MAKLDFGKMLLGYAMFIGFGTIASYAAERAGHRGAYDAAHAELRRLNNEDKWKKKRLEYEQKRKREEIEKQDKIPINVIVKQVKVKVRMIRAEKELEECENELLDIIERYHPEA